MEKILLFFMILFSGRHLQNAVDFGLKIKVKSRHVQMSEKTQNLNCYKGLSPLVSIFKSDYCFKKLNLKKEPPVSQIFSFSKKRKPPSTKGGLKVYISAKVWSVIYFVN